MSTITEAGTLVALAAQAAAQAKDAENTAKRSRKAADETVIDVFTANDIKTFVLPNGDRVTVVRPEGGTVKRNDKALAELVPGSVWDAITTRVVDEKRLAEAIAAGLLDPSVVQSVTSVTPKAPSVRITFDAVDTEGVAAE